MKILSKYSFALLHLKHSPKVFLKVHAFAETDKIKWKPEPEPEPCMCENLDYDWDRGSILTQEMTDMLWRHWESSHYMWNNNNKYFPTCKNQPSSVCIIKYEIQDY